MIDTSPAQQQVQDLTWLYNVVYSLYVLFGILTVVGTLFVGIYGTKLQNAIKSHAEANIATANAEAAKANEGLARSNEEIARLTAEANKSRESIAMAQAAAAKANQRAKELALQTLQLETSLKEERNTRLELEQSLAPREIADWQAAINRLKPFGGTRVLIESSADAEAAKTAERITSMLREAGWNITGSLKSQDVLAYPEGVRIDIPITLEKGPGPHFATRLEETAFVLGGVLDDCKIETHILGILPPNNEPSDTLRIKIGLKPQPYFLPEEFKKILKQLHSLVSDKELSGWTKRKRNRRELRLLQVEQEKQP
jgi:hypothetical protein